METKLKLEQFPAFCSKNFQGWEAINNFNTCRNGRIILLWNPARAKVDILAVEAQVIHAKIHCPFSGNSFHFSLCYGYNAITERRLLWDSLITNVPFDISSLVFRDFNSVLDPEERLGGQIPKDREFCEFVDTIAFLGLQDAPSIGCSFTWSNGVVSSKIDRILISSTWMEANWCCNANFLLTAVIQITPHV